MGGGYGNLRFFLVHSISFDFHVRLAAVCQFVVGFPFVCKQLLHSLFQAGLASLLQAQRVNDGAYRSIELHLRPVCAVSINSLKGCLWLAGLKEKKF